MPNARIKICPKCKKIVEAKHHLNPGYVGFLESVPIWIEHPCGYKGLPISVSKGDFLKLNKKK